MLDVSPFCAAGCEVSVYDDGETGIRYGLYGIVVHQGRLGAGQQNTN